MNELALFCGIGGGILGSYAAGNNIVAGVEQDPFRREVLLRRMWKGQIQGFPIWDDITTFDGTPFSGIVDIVSGGDPCQVHSNARRATSHATVPSLAEEFLRVVGEVRPLMVLRENPAAYHKGTYGDPDKFAEGLEGLDYTAEIVQIRACCVGADHRRARVFVLGWLSDAYCEGLEGNECEELEGEEEGRQDSNSGGPDRWSTTPRLRGGTDGVPRWMDRLRALGDSVVPKQWEAAMRLLKGEYNGQRQDD